MPEGFVPTSYIDVTGNRAATTTLAHAFYPKLSVIKLMPNSSKRSDIENIGLKDTGTIFWDLNCFLSFYDN